MELPDGWITIPEINKKGTGVVLHQGELVMCRNCKWSKHGILFAREYIQCAYPGFCPGTFVNETDFCSKGQKDDERNDIKTE